MSAAALLVVAGVFVPAALGHDHDAENIEEGEAMSPDPIVRRRHDPLDPSTISRRRSGAPVG